ncbi:hypothetical protein GCM10027059_16230 [Myceligenerans halotolerans]
MLLILTVLAAALIAVVASRGRLHPLVGGAVGLAGALATTWFFAGCALGGDVVGDNTAVQRILAVAAVVTVGAGLTRTVAAVRAGSGPSDGALLTELRSGMFRTGPWWPWLLLAPTLAVLAVFLYYPSIQTFALSTKLARMGAPRSADVCLSNFAELLVPAPYLVAGLPLAAVAVVAGLSLWRSRTTAGTASHTVAAALAPLGPIAVVVALYFVFAPGRTGYRGVYVATVGISLGIVAVSMVAGLALAYLVARRFRGASVYRTLLIWPYAVSPPVAGILFFMMFDPTAGVMAHLADVVGLDFPSYRSDGVLAQAAIVLAASWKWVGHNILFYVAALQTVPRDIVEAAAIDGAGAWRRFARIIVPTIAPVTFFLLVTNLTYAFFDVYGTIDYLTRGGPSGQTTVAIYEIIRVGVGTGDLGRGAAQSVILFIAVIGLTVWQFRRSEGRITYGGGA